MPDHLIKEAGKIKLLPQPNLRFLHFSALFVNFYLDCQKNAFAV